MSPSPIGKAEGRRRIIPVAALLLCAALFSALGVWQVKRLAWKEALIAQVTAVTKAPPVPADTLPFTPPAPALEYRHVTLSGQFEPQASALVTALTELGGGYWQMVPLRLEDGRMVWINRGFLPLGTKREAAIASVPRGVVAITGLLRRSDPDGDWLRTNDPAAERWYFRAIPTLSAARHIQTAAWFVDAQGPQRAGDAVPGLTVLQFPNNHLQYALTWFALALGSLGAIVLVLRERR